MVIHKQVIWSQDFVVSYFNTQNLNRKSKAYPDLPVLEKFAEHHTDNNRQ